jgi:biopolymer transport protein ExbD
MFFDATDDAPYGEAVKVMDVCRGAGAITIGLLTEPTKK